MTFVSVDMTGDAATMSLEALQRLQDRWDGWEPNDGDLEVIQIETLAPLVADAIDVASEVPDAIFRAYGTQLVGESYRVGTPAVGSATFAALDNAGYQSDDVVQIALAGQAFVTDDLLIIPAGQTEVTQTITALVEGDVANGLNGAADPITALSWIDTITVTDLTGGGVEAEDDDAYQDRLSDFLQLQSTTLVTARDYELMALQQPGVGRAKATFDQARKVIVTVTDEDGEAVPQPIKDNLVALFEGYRQVNTLYSVVDPLYTTITVTFQVVALPDYDNADLHDRAVAAVENWLSPASWGIPQGQREDAQTTTWLDSETIVRYSELLRVLSIDGVRYVDSANTRLNGGTADVALTATPTQPHPLTRPGSIDGTVLSA
jgi:hypothetical protein